MPLLPTVGRRSWKLRSLILAMYFVLSLGGVTMVYPYMLMIATSVCSMQDYDEYRIVPAYVHADAALWNKYVYEMASLPRLGYEFGTLGYDPDFPKWQTRQDIQPIPPLSEWLAGAPGKPSYAAASRTAADYREFLRRIPRPHLWRSVWFAEDKARFDVMRLYQDWLRRRFSLDEFGRRVGAVLEGWDLVFPPAQLFDQHTFWPEESEAQRLWLEFVANDLPAQYMRPQSVNYAWYYFISRQPCAEGAERNFETAQEYNQTFGTHWDRISDIVFPLAAPVSPPASTRAAVLRELFLREWLPISMKRLNAPAEAFHDFVRDAYRSSDPNAPPLAYYNSVHGTTFSDWEQVPVFADPPLSNADRRDWVEFLAKKRNDGEPYCRLEWIEIISPEAAFHEQLRARYGSIEALNAAWESDYTTFDEIRFPNALNAMVAFMENRAAIRRQFLTGNYVDVFNFVAGHGWAMWNTMFLVIATIVATLTVNPMAAYALSRFRLKFTNQILLFLLATMAFPAEVAMIPQFLLVKNLGLLNTYWALILPGLANGFGIFLLKGFFDSLPPELYEAALIDGAGEMRMFWNITLPLCKPILAVIALGAFGGAYGAFMYAFLVCQDRDMWTLMVFLFEFQQRASVPLTMASLVLASVPTLVVFIFCQNIILRGIVVPSFK